MLSVAKCVKMHGSTQPLAVDVHVVLAGDAAVDPGRVAPEVDREERLGVADAVDVEAELVALLRREHQARVGIAPDRHVEEVPRQERALGDERVDELVADDGLPVSRVTVHE